MLLTAAACDLVCTVVLSACCGAQVYYDFTHKKTQQVKRLQGLNRERVKTYLEGGRVRDGRRCEGTAAKGRRGVEEEESEKNGGETGDLTHLVKVKKEKRE